MSPAEAADEGGRPAKAKGGRPRRAKGGRTSEAKGDASPRPAKGRPARKRTNPLGRLRTGEAIYLVAAVLLFILMFFTWYGTEYGGATPAGSELEFLTVAKGGNAWQLLDWIPLFLMLAIAVAVGAALLRILGSKWKPAIPPGAAVCALGLLAAALILFRIISPPGRGAIEGFTPKANLEVAIFLALAAALGIAYGGWRAMADEGTSFAGIAKRLEAPRRPKPAAKKPASPRRPSRKKP
jgi:hypothetical protein